jgi:Amt family ammonium transporter
VFAIITVALITGAFAERIKFGAFVLFSLLWATLVYDPLAHWVWGGGWLMKLGALDFAGGTVVHISSGVSALVAAIVIGKRIGYPKRVLPPHNLSYTLIGASLLWFGWFGFNAGSALGASGLAASAFATTNTAAAVAGLTWAFIEWAFRGKPTVLGAATGAVAGLVAITPAAGYVTVGAALAIGAGASIVCYLGINKIKARFGYDDTLDVFGVHGLGGTWGAIATGIFASKAVNPAGADGLLYGNARQVWIQLIGVGAGWLLAGVGTLVILKLVGAIMPLRVTEEEEITGLDVALHGEVAYNLLGPGMTGGSGVSATHESAFSHSAGSAEGSRDR